MLADIPAIASEPASSETGTPASKPVVSAVPAAPVVPQPTDDPDVTVRDGQRPLTGATVAVPAPLIFRRLMLLLRLRAGSASSAAASREGRRSRSRLPRSDGSGDQVPAFAVVGRVGFQAQLAFQAGGKGGGHLVLAVHHEYVAGLLLKGGDSSASDRRCRHGR